MDLQLNILLVEEKDYPSQCQYDHLTIPATMVVRFETHRHHMGYVEQVRKTFQIYIFLISK